MSKAPQFEEFHDENSSTRSTTALTAPSALDVEAPPPPAALTPEQERAVKYAKRLQWIMCGLCVTLFFLIIIVLIVYGTRTSCSNTTSIIDDAITIEAWNDTTLTRYTIVVYSQNWIVTRDCYRGWSSRPESSKPLYSIGTIALYDWNGASSEVSNYRQLWQQRFDNIYGAIFSATAVAQEGDFLHFVASTRASTWPVLYTYNRMTGALNASPLTGATEWGFITFGLDTATPYLYYIDPELYGHMLLMSGTDYSQSWDFNDQQLQYPEAAGYYNSSRIIVNQVPVATGVQSEVDYIVNNVPPLTSPYSGPWQGAVPGVTTIAVYFDINNEQRVMIGPTAVDSSPRPGTSCYWYESGGVTSVTENWAQQLCDGVLFEQIANGYSLVDIFGQREIIIPFKNDWQILSVTWIAFPQSTVQMWVDPSRDSRPYTTRPFVLVSDVQPNGIYLPGYFPEEPN